MNTKFYFFLLLYFFMHITSNAQKTIPVTKDSIHRGDFGPSKTVVKLDPLTRLPIGNVPFDRTFILRVYFEKNTAEEVSSFYLIDKKDISQFIPLDFYFCSVVEANKYDKLDDLISIYSAIDIVIPALNPNRDYEIRYSSLSQEVIEHYLKVFALFYENKTPEGKKLQADYKKNSYDKGVPTDNFTLEYYNDCNLKQIYDRYNGDTSKANKDVVQFMKNNNKLTVTGVGLIHDFFNPVSSYASLSKVSTYVYTVQSSSKYRIVADGGVIYTGWQQGFNTATPYVGINISFRPIDTDIPFRTLVRNKGIKFYQRFTANFGLTLNSIAKDNYRTNLFSNNNVMVGLGFKVSHAINLNFGGLLYNNIDTNPLIAKKTLGVAPYAGISINLLIKDALGDIAKVFSYGK